MADALDARRTSRLSCVRRARKARYGPAEFEAGASGDRLRSPLSDMATRLRDKTLEWNESVSSSGVKADWSGRRGQTPRVPITGSSSLIGWVDGVWRLGP